MLLMQLYLNLSIKSSLSVYSTLSIARKKILIELNFHQLETKNETIIRSMKINPSTCLVNAWDRNSEGKKIGGEGGRGDDDYDDIALGVYHLRLLE